MHFCKKRSQGQRQQQAPVTAALYVLKILTKIEKERTSRLYQSPGAQSSEKPVSRARAWLILSQVSKNKIK